MAAASRNRRRGAGRVVRPRPSPGPHVAEVAWTNWRNASQPSRCASRPSSRHWATWSSSPRPPTLRPGEACTVRGGIRHERCTACRWNDRGVGVGADRGVRGVGGTRRANSTMAPTRTTLAPTSRSEPVSVPVSDSDVSGVESCAGAPTACRRRRGCGFCSSGARWHGCDRRARRHLVRIDRRTAARTWRLAPARRHRGRLGGCGGHRLCRPGRLAGGWRVGRAGRRLGGHVLSPSGPLRFVGDRPFRRFSRRRGRRLRRRGDGRAAVVVDRLSFAGPVLARILL